jgi:hypothetical protein
MTRYEYDDATGGWSRNGVPISYAPRGGLLDMSAIHAEAVRQAGRPTSPPITYRPGEAQRCSCMIGGVLPCKLLPDHHGRHDPAPEPDPFDHNPDWAIHPRGRKNGKTSAASR